ncbi:hypothetical protein HK405_010749, partial [Cladochytrium tenue]
MDDTTTATTSTTGPPSPQPSSSRETTVALEQDPLPTRLPVRQQQQQQQRPAAQRQRRRQQQQQDQQQPRRWQSRERQTNNGTRRAPGQGPGRPRGGRGTLLSRLETMVRRMVGEVVEEEALGPQGTLSTAARSERTTAAWTTGEVRRAIAAVARMFGDYKHDDNNNPVVTCPHCDDGHVTLRVLATAAQVLMKRRRALDEEARELAYDNDDGAVGHDAQGRGRLAGGVSAAVAKTVVHCNRGCFLEFALEPAANTGPGSEVSRTQAGTSAAVDRT